MADDRLDDVSSRIQQIQAENEDRKERMTSRRDGLDIHKKLDDAQVDARQAKDKQERQEHLADNHPEKEKPQARADDLLFGYNRADIDQALGPFGFQEIVRRQLLDIDATIESMLARLEFLENADVSDPIRKGSSDPITEFPFAKRFCFGLTRTGVNEFTLWNGYITHGSNTVIEVAAITGITVTNDNDYIGIEYDTRSGGTSLYQSTTYPISDGAVYRKAMYKFTYDSGNGIAKVIKTGGGIIGGGQPIDIPSRFADRG